MGPVQANPADVPCRIVDHSNRYDELKVSPWAGGMTLPTKATLPSPVLDMRLGRVLCLNFFV